MIENGFSVFFLLSLLASGAALARLFWADRARISAALSGDLMRAEAGTLCAVSQRPTAEVPWVAQRLLVGDWQEPAPSEQESEFWAFTFLRERPRQLSLPFANVG